jgi:hypothetical protein
MDRTNRLLGIPNNKSDDQLRSTVITFNRNNLDPKIQPDGENFHYILPKPVLCTKFKIDSVYIPNSVFHVGPHNNTIVFVKDTGTSASPDEKTATLTSGHYDDITDLLAEVLTQLNTAAGGAAFASVTIPKTGNITENKIKIVAVDGTFKIEVYKSSAIHLLGLAHTQGRSPGDFYTSTGVNLTAERCHSFQGPEFFNLQIDQLYSNNQLSGNKSGIVAEISNNGAGVASSYVSLNNDFIDLDGVQLISILTTRVIDDNGSVINLNGLNLHFKIRFVQPDYS